MKLNKTNSQLSYLLHFCVVMSMLFVFVNSCIGQTMASISEGEIKQINQSEVINLIDLLEHLKEATGFTFVFDKKIIQDKTVVFDKVIHQNLNRLLIKEIAAQTNLSFNAITDNVYTIKRVRKTEIAIRGIAKDKAGNPMIGANISLFSEGKGVTTNEIGAFELIVQQGRHAIRASYVGYESITKNIEVDGYEEIQLDFEFKKHLKLEEILVVGNRFLPKTLQETAVPVDVVSQERLNQSNQNELGQVLQYETPSFHSATQTISDGTDHVDPISLKGLGPDQVLILVNGKRRHFSSLVNVNGTVGRGSVGTDLNAIPLAAIKKIEILKDGAAALYGSDAIGGVINLQLKEQVDQGQIQLNTSITEAGDGEQFSLSSHIGIKTLKKGHTNVTFYFQNRAAVNRSGAYEGIIFGDSRDENEDLVNDFFAQTGFGNGRVMSAGSSALTNTGLFLNMALPIGDNFKFYNHSSFNYRLGQADGFYRFPFQEVKQSGLYPLGFSPKIQTNIFDFSTVSGIKGRIADWQIDLSNNTGQNSFGFNIHNSNNASLGLRSPTSADAGGFAYLQNLFNVDVTRKGVWNLPINIAFGSEFRLEKYMQKEGEEVSWENYGELTEDGFPKDAGFQVFRGFQPENAIQKFRNNVGFYGEIEGEINKKWLLALAGRFEKYSDFGSHVSWKISSRYRINQTLTIRSTFNTGFRAPSLQQNYFSSYSLQFLPVGGEIIATQVAHDNHDSPIVRLLEIPNLRPEISNNFSIGFATQPIKNLSFTLDAYHIKIKNRVVLSGQISPKEEDYQLRDILTSSGVDRIQFFTNGIDTKTKGLDARLNYEKRFRHSRLNLFMGFHVNETEVQQHESPTALLQEYQAAVFSREEVARLERGQPASKLILSGDYQKGKFSFLARSTRFGSVEYIHPTDGNTTNWVINQYNGLYESRDQLFTAKWISDIDLSMQVAKSFKMTLAVNNIFNVYPDKHQHYANTNNGVLQYSRRVQQFGVRGRSWILKAFFQFGI